MNIPLFTRVLLRLLALAAVTSGYMTDSTASVVYQNADVVAMVSLLISEAYFGFDKWRNARADKHV
jgi:hypothetical protein|tara:strand:- start:490 stop:687 length:198 start_codon:yes stop_codon:yes gene_type:complete